MHLFRGMGGDGRNGDGSAENIHVGDQHTLQPGQAIYYTEAGLEIGPSDQRNLSAWRGDDGYGASATISNREVAIQVSIVGYPATADLLAAVLLEKLAGIHLPGHGLA